MKWSHSKSIYFVKKKKLHKSLQKFSVLFIIPKKLSLILRNFYEKRQSETGVENLSHLLLIIAAEYWINEEEKCISVVIAKYWLQVYETHYPTAINYYYGVRHFSGKEICRKMLILIVQCQFYENRMNRFFFHNKYPLLFI